jgi:exo-1,4-beta-D-glucosaminidase
MPNGAFYATKKAGEPLHALYNYENNSVYLVNDRLENEENIELVITAYDINSNIIFSDKLRKSIDANTSINILSLPKFDIPSDVYFIDLRVYNDAIEIANNFYWLSKKKDILDYDFEFDSWYYHTPSKQYADFSSLNTMERAKVDYKLISIEDNENSDYTFFKVELKNISENIAFFIELQLVEKESGEIILPIIWSDNYVSLLPNEKRVVSVKVDNKYIKENIELRVNGYNN